MNRSLYKLIILVLLPCMTDIYSQALKSVSYGRTGLTTGWIMHYPDSVIDSIVSGCAQTGITYIRIDFPWPEIQKRHSREYDWTALDKVVNIVRKHDIKIIALTDYFPSWLDNDLDNNYWYNFVYKAGLRYVPLGVDVWELYNEPNSDYFYKNPDTEQYVKRILIPGSMAIRRAARELGKTVTVLTGGVAPVPTRGKDISPIDFIRGIYVHGGKNYFDAVATHPYTWPADPAIYTEFNWLLRTGEIYDIMRQNGDEKKKIWATETGFPTCPKGVDEITQSTYIQKCFEEWFSHDWAGPLLWYTYYDKGANQTDPEDHFGLIRNDWSPKPSLATFRILVQKYEQRKR